MSNRKFRDSEKNTKNKPLNKPKGGTIMKLTISKPLNLAARRRSFMRHLFALLAAILVVSPSLSGNAAAQTGEKTSSIQTTGTIGSPSATTTIPGNQLPAPDPKFGGVIKETAEDSKPYWPPRVVPPKGAPNVLLIMTDD